MHREDRALVREGVLIDWPRRHFSTPRAASVCTIVDPDPVRPACHVAR